MYDGLTISDKPALLEAKERGKTTLTMAFSDRVQVVNIDLALAQIEEMEVAGKPLTWNERINQMTAEEKRKLMTENLTACVYKKFNKSVPIGACSKKKCGDCWEEFFASPYTEGETK